MEFNEDEIDKLITEANDLAEAGHESEDVKEMCEIEVAPDKMSATITFTKPEANGEYLMLEEIEAAISAAGIVYGKLDDIINLLALPTKMYNTPIEIAQGLPPVESQDAYIEYPYQKNSDELTLKEKDDGSVDLFDLGLIQNVEKDSVIAILHPAVDGTNGKDILGTDLPVTPGKPIMLVAGKGTRLSEDGMQLLADIAGQLIDDGGKLSVQNIYEINSDVDTQTGNINFLGSVMVKGSVRSGFKIVAEGNVEIGGVVEAAYIEAGGDIIISGGMQGSKIGKVKACGDVVAKFFENAIVEAKGNVVADAIMHSEVKCEGTVTAQGKKGLIVGGLIDAYKGIRAKTIGSHMATQTELNVGVNLEIGEKYKELQDIYANNKKETLQTQQIITILAKKKIDLGGLPQDKEDMLQKAIKTKEYLDSKMPVIEEKMNALREVMENVNKFTVEATDAIHPGVRVNIANEKKNVSEELIHCRLSKRDGEVRVDVL